MWKIVVGFVLFAALSMFVIMKGGDKLDMGGEKHDAGSTHAPATPAAVTTLAANELPQLDAAPVADDAGTPPLAPRFSAFGQSARTRERSLLSPTASTVNQAGTLD